MPGIVYIKFITFPSQKLPVNRGSKDKKKKKKKPYHFTKCVVPYCCHSALKGAYL